MMPYEEARGNSGKEKLPHLRGRKVQQNQAQGQEEREKLLHSRSSHTGEAQGLIITDNSIQSGV